jgi:hypothetical protein
MFCVSLEPGERLMLREDEGEMMSNIFRVLRLLAFVQLAGRWCLEFPLTS